MQIKQIILSIVVLILIENSLQAQQKWSLNQCISYALENNSDIKDFDIQEKLSREAFNQSKRNLLPGINAFSSAGLSYGRSIDPITNDYITREFFNNSYDLGASVTLFNGFRLQNQIKYQKFRKQISEYNRLNAMDDLAFQVMTAFFDVFYFQGMHEIASGQVETSKINLETTEKQVQVGLKAKSDLLEMRANLEKEEVNRIQIENSKKSAMLRLLQHMNFTSSHAPELIAEPLETVSEVKYDVKILSTTFTTWSPYYLSFEADFKASEKYLAVSRSNLYPYITARMSVYTGFSETNKNTNGRVIGFGTQFQNNQSRYLGVSLGFPVFNRWANRSGIKTAKLEVERAKNRLESEKQKLCFAVENDLNELEALMKEYMQFQKQNEADLLAFQAAEKKFDQGLINVVEYYIAKNRLANSGSQVLRAQLQWEIKKKTIDFYQGNRFWEAEVSAQPASLK